MKATHRLSLHESGVEAAHRERADGPDGGCSSAGGPTVARPARNRYRVNSDRTGQQGYVDESEIELDHDVCR